MSTETKSRRRAETSPLYIAIGAELRRVRQLKGLSLVAVQDLSARRFDAVNLGMYERAERRVSIESLYDLAALYEVPVTAFLPSSDGSVMIPLDLLIAQLTALRDAG